jgi:PKD repeat protein
VSLAWDPNGEADLGGYRVYVGTSPGTYTQTIDVAHVTTFTVSNLSDGQTYFFAVTAYDIFTNESAFSNEVSATVALSNSPPSASFTLACLYLKCSFINTSVDSDGTVVASSWEFGDGTSSADQDASHTYAAAGTYTVTLTVKDDDGATTKTSRSISVASQATAQITLSAVGYKVKGSQRADLRWDGSASSSVDIYRNGAKITTTINDGFYTDNITKRGHGSYTYQVCEGGTSNCSAKVTVAMFK